MAKLLHIPQFNVYGIDDLPSKIPPHANWIINIDDLNRGGTHWVALHNHPSRKYVIYSDSFGLVPPPQVGDLMKKKLKGKRAMANGTQMQDISTDNCGSWAIRTLNLLEKGKSLAEIVSEMSSSNQMMNEKKLQ